VILVTGVKSGFGKHVHQKLGGIGLTRQNRLQQINELRKGELKTIIHAAFNSQTTLSQKEIYSYIDDNLFLLQEVLSVPHQKFIYISSVDVYPKDGKIHDENESIELQDLSLYGQMKLISEEMIRKHSSNWLILRCSAFLGPHSRPNSLIKILRQRNEPLSVALESVFNYVLSEDVVSFIQYAMNQDLTGIFNITSSQNMVFSEIKERFGSKIQFGKFKYDVGCVNNQKVSSIFQRFKKTSEEIMLEFSKTL